MRKTTVYIHCLFSGAAAHIYIYIYIPYSDQRICKFVCDMLIPFCEILWLFSCVFFTVLIILMSNWAKSTFYIFLQV